MKKYSLLFLLFALATGSGHAQNGYPDGIAVVEPAENWYQDGITIMADGIALKVERSKYNVFLSNVANTRTGATLYYKDGREVEELWVYKSASASVPRNKVLGAIKETFTEEELKPLQSLRKPPLTISFAVGPDGTTLEVTFSMDAVWGILAIPPAKFALLERKLKQNVQWTVNEVGMQLQYFHMIFFVRFSQIDFDSIPPFNDVKQPSEWDKTSTDDKPTAPTPRL